MPVIIQVVVFFIRHPGMLLAGICLIKRQDSRMLPVFNILK